MQTQKIDLEFNWKNGLYDTQPVEEVFEKKCGKKTEFYPFSIYQQIDIVV